MTSANYYHEAEKIVKDHFALRGVIITDESAHALIRSAVKEMLRTLPDPKGFVETSRLEDIFGELKQFMVRLLGEM